MSILQEPAPIYLGNNNSNSMTPVNLNDTTLVQSKTPFLILLGLFVCISLLNIPVVATIWQYSFDDGTYSHAYLIPFISLYLFYQLHKEQKLQFKSRFSILYFIPFVVSCYLLFVMVTAQISLGYWIALLFVYISAIAFLFKFNWKIIFPAAYFIFVLPVWGGLTVPLQNLSVNAVSFIMSFTGVPTYVEDQFVTIPAGVFEIAGGCSGLRYLIVSLAISSLFIFLNIHDKTKAILFMAVAILGALLTNWIRITALILIGDYTDMQSSLMTDHNTFGWYLYIPFMVLLFMWGNRLANKIELVKTKAPNEENLQSNNTQPKITTTALIVLSISSAQIHAPFSTSKNMVVPKQELATEALQVKPEIYAFHSYQEQFIETEQLKITQLSYYFNGVLNQGKPTAHNNIFVPAQWKELGRETIGKWQYITIKKDGEYSLLRVAFQINEHQIPSAHTFKKMRIFAALKGKKDTALHWQLIKCAADCQPEIETLSNIDTE